MSAIARTCALRCVNGTIITGVTEVNLLYCIRRLVTIASLLLLYLDLPWRLLAEVHQNTSYDVM